MTDLAPTVTSRRSFLALMAGALAVKPVKLLSPAGKNPIIKDWWRAWAVCDQVRLEPERETREVLFSSPIPSNFAIDSFAWHVEPSIPLADLRTILDSLECRLSCDGRDMCAGRIAWFGNPLSLYAFHESLAPCHITPRLVPRGDFRLEVFGDPLKLTAPVDLLFSLQGVIGA